MVITLRMAFTQNDKKNPPYIECNRPLIVVLTFTFKKVGQRPLLLNITLYKSRKIP